MEEMTVVSFYVNRLGVAWDEGWLFELREDQLECEGYSLKLIHVGLPFWKKEDTMWQKGEQKVYLQMLPIPSQGRTVCYVCDREAMLLYEFTPDNLSVEWGLFLLRYYRVDFDGVVIFEDREGNASELVLEFAPRISYVGVVSRHRWRLEPIEEYVLEEYGYQIEVADTFSKLHPRGERLLLWTGDEMHGLTPLTVPKNSMWFDASREIPRDRFARFYNKQEYNHLNIEKFLRDFGYKSCIVK